MRASSPAPKKKKSVDLTEGPIHKHVLRMVGPFWLAVLAMMSAGVIDTIYLGRLGTTELAAVGFCFPLVFLLQSANIGLGAGTLSAVSRSIGRKDAEAASANGASALILSVLVISALVFCGFLVMGSVLDLMGVTSETKPFSIQYLTFALPSVIFSGLGMMANNVLRASGEAALPSAIMISGALLNILFDPFLIFGIGPFPRLGVSGAAIATFAAYGISALFGLYVVIFHRKSVRFSGLGFARIKKAWGRIGSVGLPAMVSNMIVPFSTFIAISFVGNMMGETEVAAFTVVSRTGALALTFLYALSACIGAITGQNGGAGLNDRVRATFGFCNKACLAWGLLIACLMAPFAHVIPQIFSTDPEVIALCVKYFWIVPITFAGYGLVFVNAAGLNALGRPRYGLIYTIIRSLCLYVPLIYVGIKFGGLTGVYIAIACANVIAGVIASVYTWKRVPLSVSAD